MRDCDIYWWLGHFYDTRARAKAVAAYQKRWAMLRKIERQKEQKRWAILRKIERQEVRRTVPSILTRSAIAAADAAMSNLSFMMYERYWRENLQSYFVTTRSATKAQDALHKWWKQRLWTMLWKMEDGEAILRCLNNRTNTSFENLLRQH
jgi:hypothetical protein